MKTITEKEIKDPRNYTLWGGYVETPVSFNPLGDQWLGDLQVETEKGVRTESIRTWIKNNWEYVAEILENSGFKVVESKKKLEKVI